ncbi:MAG: thioredoxin-like domain-containing protein [Arenicellales bacterium]|nr:thioredoxin-like domain-containing protein [Arenicellales bacterium]
MLLNLRRFAFLSLFSTLLLLLLTPSWTTTASEHNSDAKKFEFDSKLQWLNVERPLTLKELRGKVTVLDFWTYGCINCMHVLVDLAKLEQKYGNRLAVIGVHTPKFDNEKNVETLRQIVIRYDIHHPVVNDTDWQIGNYYGMRAWPTQVVIDPAGEVLGKVEGEGNYDVLDQVIDRLLDKHSEVIVDKPLPISLEKDRLKRSFLAAPGKLTVSDRYVAISDTLNHRIVLASHDGKVQRIFGDGQAGLRDGESETVRFSSPQGLVFNDNGLFVADTGNHAVRFIDLKLGSVNTIAGGGKRELSRAGKFDALEVSLRSPWGLALREPWLYIAMAGTHQIWRLNLNSGQISSFAGNGREGIVNGDVVDATFSQPSGLSISGDWLYVADAEASAVRRVNLDRKRVDTLIGTGLFDFGDRDGPFWDAMLQHVLGIAALDEASILIADTYNHKLRLLDLSKRSVRTLVGTGKPGNRLGTGEKAQLNEPGGLAVLGRKVLIADTNNHRIAQYDLETQKLDEWRLFQ